jgi:hypothetical protein
VVQYLLRKPKYPLLIETDRRVSGARSGQGIDRLCKQASFARKESYIVVDSAGEGWSFFPANEVISPLTTLKLWSKAGEYRSICSALVRIDSSFFIAMLAKYR